MKKREGFVQARCPRCKMVVTAGSVHWHTGPFEAKPIRVIAVDGLPIDDHGFTTDEHDRGQAK